MSRAALLISVALACAALLAVWLAGRGRTIDPESPLLALRTAEATALTIEHAGRTLTVARTPAGGWELREPSSPTWPLNPAAVRGALRLLADLRPRGAYADAMPPDAARITVERDAAPPLAVRVGARALAGLVPAQAGEQRAPALVDASAAALLDPGPRAWRDTSAMPGVGADVHRLDLRRGPQRVLLERRGPRWRVREPFPGRASPDAAAAAAQALASVTVRRFLDGAPPDGASLDAPWLVAVAETDARTPGPDGAAVTTRRRTLTVGAPASADGSSRYAAPGDGPAWFVVSAEPLDALAADPLAYASRTATDAAPADVGMLALRHEQGGETGLRRGLDGWERLSEAAAPEPVDGADALAALEFLSERLAREVIAADAAPEGFTRRATVRLLGFADEPLDALEVYEGPGGAIAVRRAADADDDDRLWRLYDAPAPALLLTASPLGGR